MFGESDGVADSSARLGRAVRVGGPAVDDADATAPDGRFLRRRGRVVVGVDQGLGAGLAPLVPAQVPQAAARRARPHPQAQDHRSGSTLVPVR